MKILDDGAFWMDRALRAETECEQLRARLAEVELERDAMAAEIKNRNEDWAGKLAADICAAGEQEYESVLPTALESLADLRRQVEALREAAPEEILSAIARRNATIARLRAVARAAQLLAFDMPGVTVVEGERDFDAALSALAPGDLAAEGT